MSNLPAHIVELLKLQSVWLIAEQVVLDMLDGHATYYDLESVLADFGYTDDTYTWSN